MHPEMPSADVRVVVQALRDYLLKNPRAADTAAGIQRWWLLPSFGELSLLTVEAALAQLEQEGAVCKLENNWGGPAWAGTAGDLPGADDVPGMSGANGEAAR